MFDEILEMTQARLEGLHTLVIGAMCVAVGVIASLCLFLILRWGSFRSMIVRRRREKSEEEEAEDEKRRRRVRVWFW